MTPAQPAAAARLAPHDPDLLFARALASHEAGTASPQQVVAWTEVALQLGLRFSPSAVTAHILMGRCYMLLERWEDAELALARALRREPWNEAARTMMGKIPRPGQDPGTGLRSTAAPPR